MKQFLLSFCFLALLPTAIFAQSTPVYECMSSIMPNGPTGCASLFNHIPPYANQIIYTQNDFPGMPIQGTITDLYILVHGTAKGVKLDNLTIQMGMTSLCSFTQNMEHTPKITAGMDTVFYDSVYIVKDSMWDTTWWRIPLQQPFHYDFTTVGDSCKNILLEIYGRGKPAFEGASFSVNIGNFCYGVPMVERSIFIDSATMHYGYRSFSYYKIGFNPKPDPVGVQEVHSTHLSLYPNPAKASIHFSHQGKYTISTLQGAIVQQDEGDVANIGTLSQGLYIVQLSTKNGERLVGRFLKE
jgi:hypothetical protein